MHTQNFMSSWGYLRARNQAIALKQRLEILGRVDQPQTLRQKLDHLQPHKSGKLVKVVKMVKRTWEMKVVTSIHKEKEKKKAERSMAKSKRRMKERLTTAKTHEEKEKLKKSMTKRTAGKTKSASIR
eukprot:GHVN01004152.1.p1 GENE.GHVN01004152.1~~GHVN01004152.1.p1  ORF type:complete len:127 (+),score=23.72 GHVN01004152.1:293-673(+)